jgi:peptidoglycan/LPS O-acetylase OafA/YrhL
MVLLAHFIPQIQSPPLGAMGVRFFFVLSTFLATRSLLRKSSETFNPGMAWKLSVPFWENRFMRIAPLYMTAIGLFALMDIPPVRAIFGWLVCFGTNIYMATSNLWAGAVSHLWYLAVDAQFFLIWPLLLLATPRRWHGALVALLIGLAIAARYYFHQTGANVFLTWFSLPSNLDSLGIGALLALIDSRNAKGLERVLRLPVTFLLMLTLAVIAFVYRSPFQLLAENVGPISETVECILYALIVGGAWYGFRGTLGFFLASPPMRFIGTISFAIYIFHAPVNWLLEHYATRFGIPWADGNLIPVMTAVLTSIAVATLAWLAIERPIEARRHR